MQIYSIFSNFGIKIILSVIMIYIAYKPKKIKVFIKELVMFYLISFVFGGCALSLLYLIRPKEIIMKNGIYVGTYPLKIVILGGLIGFGITAIAFKIVKTKFGKRDMVCDISIFFENKSVKIKALIDTGNLLKEPISGNSVIIVQKDKLYNVLPKEILDNTDKIIKGNNIENIYKEENLEYISKFRVIPFTSIGNENGLLLGFKTEEVHVYIEEKTYKTNNVVVGIYDKTLSKKGNYFSLIGLDLIEGGKESEFSSISKE